MPKNKNGPTMNTTDRKSNPLGEGTYSKEVQTLTSKKAADYVPSLNEVNKNDV